MSDYKLLTRWESRQESAPVCAAHLARMLARLALIDPVFAKWHRLGYSRASAMKPFCRMPPDLDELTKIVEAKRALYDARDAQGRRIPNPELGFSISAWNGADKNLGASFHVNCGAYTSFHPRPNRADIEFAGMNAAGRHWRGSELKPLIMATVQSWNANYAVITTNKFGSFIPRVETNNKGYRWPWAGWLTYLAPPDALKITPPPSVMSERLPDGGLLTILCDEPFDTQNLRHLELAAEMQRALEPVNWS